VDANVLPFAGNDCTTYYSGRRLLSLITEVDFQINIPDGSDLTKVFTTMASSLFLISIAKELSTSMNRDIGAAYVRAPEEVIEAAAGSDTGFGANASLVRTSGDELLESEADLSFQLNVVIIVVIIIAGMCASLAALLVISRRRRDNLLEEKMRIKGVVKARLAARETRGPPTSSNGASTPLANSREFDSIDSITSHVRTWSEQSSGASHRLAAGSAAAHATANNSNLLVSRMADLDEQSADVSLTPPTNNSASFSPNDLSLGGMGLLTLGGLGGQNSTLSRSGVPPPPPSDQDDNGVATQRRRYVARLSLLRHVKS